MNRSTRLWLELQFSAILSDLESAIRSAVASTPELDDGEVGHFDRLVGNAFQTCNGDIAAALDRLDTALRESAS